MFNIPTEAFGQFISATNALAQAIDKHARAVQNLADSQLNLASEL